MVQRRRLSARSGGLPFWLLSDSLTVRRHKVVASASRFATIRGALKFHEEPQSHQPMSVLGSMRAADGSWPNC